MNNERWCTIGEDFALNLDKISALQIKKLSPGQSVKGMKPGAECILEAYDGGEYPILVISGTEEECRDVKAQLIGEKADAT